MTQVGNGGVVQLHDLRLVVACLRHRKRWEACPKLVVWPLLAPEATVLQDDGAGTQQRLQHIHSGDVFLPDVAAILQPD